jgi:hypothetical protein
MFPYQPIISDKAKNLILSLLEKDPINRLGSYSNKSEGYL